MGKTVKSRSIMSIASFLLVVAFCLVANTSVPKLYESYKQKEAAQQASTQAAQVIKKQNPVNQTADDTAPAEEPIDDTASEDTNVYDIPEEPVVDEEPVEEDTSAEEDSDFDIDTGDDTTKEEKTGILDSILNFFKSLFDKISSFKLLGKLKDFFIKFLSLFGIKL